MFSKDAVAGIRVPSRSGVVAIMVISDELATLATDESNIATRDTNNDSAIVEPNQHAPCLRDARWRIVRAGVISALTIRQVYCRNSCPSTGENIKHKLYGVNLGVLVARDESNDEEAQIADDCGLVARAKLFSGSKVTKTMILNKQLPAGLPIPRDCRYYSFPRTDVAYTCPSFDALCCKGKDFAKSHGYLCGPMYESIKFMWTTGKHAAVCAFIKLEPFRIDCPGDNTAVTFISSAMPVTLHRMFI